MVSMFTNVPAFFNSYRSLALAVAVLLSQAAPIVKAQDQSCKSTVYLTLDTGNMRDAEPIAEVLKRHQIKATFFVANEDSWPDRKARALEPAWQSYWQERVKEGHAFGSHTWRHGLFSAGQSPSTVSYKPQFVREVGQLVQLDQEAVCAELNEPKKAFAKLTGKSLAGIWRAPGGRTHERLIQFAKACGYEHVHWAAAGFLGDELPSEKYPNHMLLQRALRDIRNGDILIAHLGIWSRKERFFPIFEPLVVGLKDRGFCFATLETHPQFKSRFN